MEMGVSRVSFVFEILARVPYNKILANLQCVCSLLEPYWGILALSCSEWSLLCSVLAARTSGNIRQYGPRTGLVRGEY